MSKRNSTDPTVVGNSPDGGPDIAKPENPGAIVGGLWGLLTGAFVAALLTEFGIAQQIWMSVLIGSTALGALAGYGLYLTKTSFIRALPIGAVFGFATGRLLEGWLGLKAPLKEYGLFIGIGVTVVAAAVWDTLSRPSTE